LLLFISFGRKTFGTFQMKSTKKILEEKAPTMGIYKLGFSCYYYGGGWSGWWPWVLTL